MDTTIVYLDYIGNMALDKIPIYPIFYLLKGDYRLMWTWACLRLHKIMGLEAASMRKMSGSFCEILSLKGLYWEPQIGNPKNIAGIYRYIPIIYLLYSWGSRSGVPSRVPLIFFQILVRSRSTLHSCYWQ